MDTSTSNSGGTAASRSNLQNASHSHDSDQMNGINIPLDGDKCRKSNEPEQSFASSDSDEMVQEPNDDAGNERDRYSPSRCALSLPIQAHNDNGSSTSFAAANSVQAPRRSFDITRISSKEEKQRQNEERKTPASSSNADAPLTAFEIECSTVSPNEHNGQETAFPRKTKSTIYVEKPAEQQTAKPNAGTEINCFIDASTLLDDGEIAFTNTFKSNPINATANDTNATTSHEPNLDDAVSSKRNVDTKNDQNMQHIYGDILELKKSKENINEEFDRDETEAVINLSDEQKLSTQKSFESGVRRLEIKDQYAAETPISELKTVSLNMLNDFELRGDCAKGGCAESQENERKQGHFLFSNSIQQFSGHAMSGNMPYFEENQSDFSLPSIYSGGSDCASTFDTSSHISSDRDSHDLGELSNFSIGNMTKGDSVIYPDTPHNSILQVNLSRNSLGPNDSAIASLSSSESNTISIPPRRSYDDTLPILSGGASVKDFTPKQCESPSMKRKTENCPIISVAMSPKDFEIKQKPRERITNQGINSWIVDMSDCKRNRRRDSESSFVSVESNRFSDSKPEQCSSNSSSKGLGYYVSLNDMKPSYLADESLSKSLNYHSSGSSCTSAESRKKSTGFFIDFSNNDSRAADTPPPSNSGLEPAEKNEDKKNIFSMFIDFGNDEHRNSTKRDANTKTTGYTRPNETNLTESQAFHRRNQTNNTQQLSDNETKRHSWNASKDSTHSAHNREHKRSVSTSSDKGIMNILDKIPLISKTSSMSIDTPNSPHDDIISKSLSSYSTNSLTSLSIQSSGSKLLEHDDKAGKRRQKDAGINETFDKSSPGSLPDDIFSKTSTPASNTDTDDVTFHNDNDDTIHGDISLSNVMETIPETKEAVVLRRSQNSSGFSKSERHTMETLQATIEKQKQLLNTVSEEASSFVKLSDMDKPAPKFELHNSDSRPKSVGSRIGKLFDNRAGSRNTWHHMSKSTGNNLSNLASSAENFKSLTRIFPHLGKDLSNSLPTNFDKSTSNTSPNEYTMDLFHSDFSTSSATSSFSRSGIDSADEFSLSAMQPRRLGEDLLKMFLQEIGTDVIIEVSGRRMRAHKCILRSRCQYFAAILAGGWVESAGNVISLSGYSYGSVHFALCHIYSGAAHPPDGISLMELAALADLLGLEGLKEVAGHALKTNYCHSFHKPCSGCIDGVMQVFPIALNQGLDDLYRKCLRWACKHYMKVWPSRSFSQLPSELVARCKQHIIAHLTSESVIYTLLDCDHLLALLAPCRWASGIESSVRDIIEAGHVYVTEHYASLIASDGFLSLGQGQSWNISRLESMLLRAGSSLTPDQACRSYQRITRLDSVLKAKVNKLHTSRIDKSIFMSDYDNEIEGEDEEELDWNPDFIRLVSEMIHAVEQCLVQQCSRAMKCNQWQRMDAELQKNIQKLACLTEPVERRHNIRPKSASNTSIVQNNRAHDLYQVKMAIQAHTKRSQEHYNAPKSAHVQQQQQQQQQQQHANDSKNINIGKVTKSSSRVQVPDLISTIKQSKSNVATKLERKPLVSAYRRSVSETGKRQAPLEKSNSSVDAYMKKSNFTEVKSRYMEPKRQPNNIKKDTLKVRARSSSGSSRTSSPVISSIIKDGSVSQSTKKSMVDSAAMSRDSLASPAKRSERLHSRQNASHQVDQERLSADSLGGSLHSSIITNRTISQESLIRADACRALESRPINKNNVGHIKSKPVQTKSVNNIVQGKTAQLKVFSAILSHTSPTVNSSTPSSVTVKSHLSSSNSISSPCSAIINRLTTPANQIPLKRSGEIKPVIKSFLSARSRQILAQKKSLSHSDSSKSVPSVIKEKISVPNAVNKSNSTSNILNKKTKIFPTTLHLRRTAKLGTPPQQPSHPPNGGSKSSARSTNPSLMNPIKCISVKMTTQNNKINQHDEPEMKLPREKRPFNRANEVQSCDNGFESMTSNDIDENHSMTGRRVESKLERSSTFCKERSNIDQNELEVID